MTSNDMPASTMLLRTTSTKEPAKDENDLCTAASSKQKEVTFGGATHRGRDLTTKEKELISAPVFAPPNRSVPALNTNSDLDKFKANQPGFNITKIDANNMDDSADSIDPLLSPKVENKDPKPKDNSAMKSNG